MAKMEESHLAAAALPAAKKQVRIRQFRAAIARVNGDARTASAHLEVAAGIIASSTPSACLNFGTPPRCTYRTMRRVPEVMESSRR